MEMFRTRSRRIAIALFLFVACGSARAVQNDVMLVLDNSGSMRKNDPQFLARGAIASFIDQLDPESHAGVLIFDESVKQAVPLTPLNEDSKRALVNSLNNITYRGQLTDSPAAVERAIYELKSNAREDANKYIIFMTDGIVDTGRPATDIEKTKWLREELATEAAEHNIKVFAIAFTEHADFFLIQSLAKKTDGEYFRALTPDTLGDVFATVNDALNAPPPADPEPIVEPVIVPAPEIVTMPEPAPIPEPKPELSPEPLPVAPSQAQLPVVTTPPAEPAALTPPAADSTAELLANLSPEDRQSLEEISADTGIPLEQLVAELVAPKVGDAAADGDAIVTYPEDSEAIVTYPEDTEASADEDKEIILLGIAALVLLFLAAIGAWFVLRGRKEPARLEDSAPGSGDRHAERSAAYLNDINSYSDQASVQLSEKPLMVGRVSGTDSQHLTYLVVDKGTIGRRHAVIKYKDFSYWVVDQGSVNGTYVNDERVSGERQLKHGDMIRFHKYAFEFSHPDMADASQTVLAVPNPDEATIVASAETIAVTSAMALAVDSLDGHETAEGENDLADDLFALDDSSADLAITDERVSPAAEDDIFDITADTEYGVKELAKSIGDADETIDDESSDLFISADQSEQSIEFVDGDATDEHEREDEYIDYDDDEDVDDSELGGAVTNVQPMSDMDFDAQASAFFDDTTTGPDVDSDAPTEIDEGDEDTFDFLGQGANRDELDAKFDQATEILQTDSKDTFDKLESAAGGESAGSDAVDDLSFDRFVETDSFDAPETVRLSNPNIAEGAPTKDATLDSFISTSMFDADKTGVGDDDKTVRLDSADDPRANDVNIGDTLVIDPPERLPSTENEDDKNDDEDTTVLT